MKKLNYILCLLFSTALLSYLYFTCNTGKNVRSNTIKLNTIVNNFTERSTLVVLESDNIGSIKLRVPRNFFSDFDLDYIVVGNFIYGIDLSGFKSKDVVITKDSLILTVPKPEVLKCTIDHTQSRFVNATWRFGINEFDWADSAYVVAQKNLYKHANSPDLLRKAEIAGEAAVKKLIEELKIDTKSIRVNYK